MASISKTYEEIYSVGSRRPLLPFPSRWPLESLQEPEPFMASTEPSLSAFLPLSAAVHPPKSQVQQVR